MSCAGASGTLVLIVGASRGAKDDVVRDVAVAVPATFGLRRLSLLQLTSKIAIFLLVAKRFTPNTSLDTKAVARHGVLLRV